MTRDLRDSSRPQSLDDGTIEQLIRDVASSWTMPAVRLDAPSWRDRVRSPRARRIAGVRGWFGRAGRAATGAVALTVVATLVAVLITRPPAGPGKSAAPTGRGSTPVPSSAAATTLPKLLLHGGAPVPASVLLAIEEGDFARIDLTTGTSSAPLTNGAYGSAILPSADGTFVCLCAQLSDNVHARPTNAQINLDHYDASGQRTTTTPVLTLNGDPDPRDGALPELPPHLTFDLRFSPDGRLGFIGWSVRKHPVWQSGVVVIDLADGHEVSRVDLADDTTGNAATRRVVTAPRLFATASNGAAVIAREWYSWSPPESEGLNYRQETAVFGATLDAGELADVTPLVSAEGCGERVIRAGTNSEGGSWIACLRTATNAIVVRRLDPSGSALGDTAFQGPSGIDGDMVALGPDKRALYAWNPLTATLARIDLATGESTEARGPVAAAERSPLADIGAWLAPTAAAKSFLYGGLVVSSDGTRVYAAGVPTGDEHEVSGSSGIFVFDAETMASLGRWEPTSDVISLAVSPDGRFVYAAGMPRVRADGQSQPAQQASLTVFDSLDGSPRLIAGELGGKFLNFVAPTLP
jgi:DNA-binding beta-propeller fold protein YncE